MNDWKIWFKLLMLSVFINLCLGTGLICGYSYFCAEAERSAAGTLQSIADLEKRNRELSGELTIARAEAARNLKSFIDLRASIKRATDQSRVSLEDARKIRDTAQRVDAIAGVLVTTIETIIKTNYGLENFNPDRVNSGSD